MKNIIKPIIALSIFSLIATSCSEDSKPSFAKPVISELEVGEGHHDHDHEAEAKATTEDHNHEGEEHSVGHIGEDLHVEAKIEAEGKIEVIKIEIHNEETGTEVVSKEFTDDKGSKNTTFHKHIDIPNDTKEGEYHFHIKVIDQEGQVTEKEVELELEHEDVE